MTDVPTRWRWMYALGSSKHVLVWNSALSLIDVIAGCALIGVLMRSSRLRAMRRRTTARAADSTFVFADLVGFTALAERCGDEKAARVADEFRRLISTLSRCHGAWHVKSMGDGAMIWAPDAARALALAGHALTAIGARADLLPVRVGAHTGPAVMQGGDWFGSAVNLAARLASEASPNEVLVSGTTRSAAEMDHCWPLTYRGELALRGVGEPVGVWRLGLRPETATKERLLPSAA